jgi:uroporphyrinogen III methyltransferase/synthase
MEKLIAHGRSPDTPVSVVQWATLPKQRVARGTLATIADIVKREKITPPALSIVGMTGSLGKTLDWFGALPLTGKRIIVTRSREQASSLVQALKRLRAETLEIPAIVIAAPDSWDQVDIAIDDLAANDWVVFTSVNGVDFFFGRLRAKGFDARKFGAAKIAAIGPATAQHLEQHGIIADLTPQSFTSQALFAECSRLGIPAGSKYLLLRADIADKDFLANLGAAGARVQDITVYKTLPAPIDAGKLRDALLNGDGPGVTFTSSSTVRNFVNAIGESFVKEITSRIHGFSIGPKTSSAMREYGIEPACEAAKNTIPGLVEAIVDYYSRNQGVKA